MRISNLKWLLMAAMLPLAMLWGCGGSSSSSPLPTPDTSKATISGTISFPSQSSLAKQAAVNSVTSGNPTVEVRDLNGNIVATATVTGSGAVSDPYKYSATGIDISGDYVIKAVSGTKVLKALVDKGSLLATTTRDIDTIAATAVILVEKNLNVALGTIGESQNSVTSSAIAALQPATLETNVKTAVNTILHSPATATQANVDITNLVNVVTAAVNTGVDPASFVAGTVTTPVTTTQYLLVGSGATANTASAVASSVASSTLTVAAAGSTPPPANSVSFTHRVLDYNTVSAGVPLQGVTVTTIGLIPAITTTTDANGLFVLAGIPKSTSFYIKMSKTTYADAYSSTFSLTANQDASDRPYALYLPAKLTDWGNQAGNGVIRSRAVSSTDQVSGYIGGAVVTATDKADGTAYPVKYIDNSTGTVSSTLTSTDPGNGGFLIVNVPAGHTVDVTATKSGYTFNTKTFAVQANGVSEARIVGSALVFFKLRVLDYNTVSAGVPLQGVTVTTVGLTPEITTTTDANGLFVLTGIPQSTSFYIKMSKATYADAYSNTFSLTANQDSSGSSYAIYLPAMLTNWGNLAGNGVIKSYVANSADGGAIGGAVVTATDKADGTTYPVKYIDNSTRAISNTLTSTDPVNGQYLVVNVPAGHTVAVTATKSGYTFNTRTFTVQANGVSESRITGTATTR